MNVQDFKKMISDRIKSLLTDAEFKKKGNWFYLTNGDLTFFIGLQSSQSSTSQTLKITINTEIASALISSLDDTNLPVVDQRHYNRRIGFYLDKMQDLWWEINSQQTAEYALAEIEQLITERVLPFFNQINTTPHLASQWRNGKSWGLTEFQRKHYLALFDNYTHANTLL